MGWGLWAVNPLGRSDPYLGLGVTPGAPMGGQGDLPSPWQYGALKSPLDLRSTNLTHLTSFEVIGGRDLVGVGALPAVGGHPGAPKGGIPNQTRHMASWGSYHSPRHVEQQFGMLDVFRGHWGSGPCSGWTTTCGRRSSWGSKGGYSKHILALASI